MLQNQIPYLKTIVISRSLYYGQNSFECFSCVLYLVNSKTQLYRWYQATLYNKVLVVHTAAIQSLQQQSDKAHHCHHKQRAHDHTGSTNNLWTLAAGDGLVAWIADVRCSIVTHHIGKSIAWCGLELLKWYNSDKRVLFNIGAQ